MSNPVIGVLKLLPLVFAVEEAEIKQCEGPGLGGVGLTRVGWVN